MVVRSPRRFSSSKTFWPRLLLGLAVVLYACYFSWLTVTRYNAFEARALDMGNLHQAIWNTAHGNWFQQTNQPGSTNRLSLHVEPFLLLIAAWYRLVPGVAPLLILQSVVVALGAIPLHLMGEKRLPTPWLALLLAVTWLLMPAIQAANWLEFHPLTFAPTFLVAAFYFLLERRVGWYAVFAVLAAACKEEMGLLVAMTGLYALIALRMRRTGILAMILGVGWSVFAVLGIQQLFGGNIHWGRYAWLGDSLTDKLTTVTTRPAVLLAQLQAAHAGNYFFKLLLPVGFLSLFAPEVLLLSAPSLALNLFADFSPMHQVDGLIYAAPIAAFVALSAVMGAARVLRWSRRRGGVIDRLTPWLVALVVAAGALTAQLLWGYLPGAGNDHRFSISDHDRAAAAILTRIQPDDRVSAQDRLDPHVAGRPYVYLFPDLSNGDAPPANVVLLDVTASSWPVHPSDVHTQAQSLLANGWGVDAAEDGYLLLREGITSTVLPPTFNTPWLAAAEPPSTAVDARFSDSLALSGVDVRRDENGEVSVRLDLTALRSLDENLVPRLTAERADGTLLYDSLFSPPVASLWYPSTMWQTGETVHVQALPWSTPDDRFTLYLSVAPEGRPEEPLPVASALPGQHALADGKLRLGGFVREGGDWVAQGRATLPKTPVDARLGDGIVLESAAVKLDSGAPSTATVTLAWGVEQTQTTDLNLFLHVIDAAGQTVAQWDGAPRDALGALPVSQWRPGEPIVATYDVALPEGLPAGAYTVVAGLYDWQTGVRLPATGSDVLPDGAVQVAHFIVQ